MQFEIWLCYFKFSSLCFRWSQWNALDLFIVLWFLSRSADYSVRMFDRRNLTSNGVGSPVYKFEGHKAAVLCVQVLINLPFLFLSFPCFYFEKSFLEVHLLAVKCSCNRVFIKSVHSFSSGLQISHLCLEVLQKMVSWIFGIMRRCGCSNSLYLSLITCTQVYTS